MDDGAGLGKCTRARIYGARLGMALENRMRWGSEEGWHGYRHGKWVKRAGSEPDDPRALAIQADGHSACVMAPRPCINRSVRRARRLNDYP